MRTLQSRLTLGQWECHEQAKKVQRGVQARGGWTDAATGHHRQPGRPRYRRGWLLGRWRLELNSAIGKAFPGSGVPRLGRNCSRGGTAAMACARSTTRTVPAPRRTYPHGSFTTLQCWNTNSETQARRNCTATPRSATAEPTRRTKNQPKRPSHNNGTAAKPLHRLCAA